MSKQRQANKAEVPKTMRMAGGQDEEEEEMVEGEEVEEMEEEKEVVEMEREGLEMWTPEEEQRKDTPPVEEMLKKAPGKSSMKVAKGSAKGVQWGTSCTFLFEWCQGYETVPSDKRSPSLAMRNDHYLMVTEFLTNTEDFARTSVGADGRRVVKRLDYFGCEDRRGLLEFLGIEVEEDEEMEVLAASRSRGCRCGGRCRRAICECRKAGVECWDWCQCGSPTWCDHCASDPTAGCSEYHSLDCGNERKERMVWKREQRVAHDRERLMRLVEMEEEEGRVFFDEEELRKFEPLPCPVGTIKLHEAESSDEDEVEGEDVEEESEEGGEEEEMAEEGEDDGVEMAMRAGLPEEEGDEWADDVEEEEEDDSWRVEAVEVEGENGLNVMRMELYPRYEVLDEDGVLIGHMQFDEGAVEEVEVGGEEEVEVEEEEGMAVERLVWEPRYPAMDELVEEEADDGELETTRSTITVNSGMMEEVEPMEYEDVVEEDGREVDVMEVDEEERGDVGEVDVESIASVSSTSTAIPLRRSTRIRKPVDRFCIPLHIPKRRGKRTGPVKKRKIRRRPRAVQAPTPPPAPVPPRQPPVRIRHLPPVPVGPAPVDLAVAARVFGFDRCGEELKKCRKELEEKNFGKDGLEVLMKLKRAEATHKRLQSPNVQATPPQERALIKAINVLRAMLGMST